MITSSNTERWLAQHRLALGLSSGGSDRTAVCDCCGQSTAASMLTALPPALCDRQRSETRALIQAQLHTFALLLYMKGKPDLPRCERSARVVALLQRDQLPFAFVDVLAQPLIGELLPEISAIQDYPQLFVDGRLLGGYTAIEQAVVDKTLLRWMEQRCNAKEAVAS